MNKKVLAVLVVVALIAGAVAFYFANPDFLQGSIAKKIRVEAIKKGAETKVKKELVTKKAKKELVEKKAKKEVVDTKAKKEIKKEVSKDVILKGKKELPAGTSSGTTAPVEDNSVPTI